VPFIPNAKDGLQGLNLAPNRQTVFCVYTLPKK
jgi:hypothetical protein